MRSFKKVLAILLTIALLFTSFPEIPGLFSFKAEAAGTLVVGASITGSSVTLTWNDVDNATAYQVIYRDPSGDLQSFKVLDNPTVAYVETTIDNLSKDFIYQFKVRAGHDVDLDDVIDRDLVPAYTKPVLLGVSFTTESLADIAVPMTGGGKEIGANPGHKFKIRHPMKWSNTEVDGAGSVTIFDGDGSLPIPDYDITLGTDNEGQNRTRIKVRYNTLIAGDDKYIVTREGNGTVKNISETVSSSVYGVEPGWIVFDVLGGTDNEPYIDRDDAGNDIYDAANKTGFKDYNITDFTGVTAYDLADIYKNPDITPGTVLRMSVKPVFPANTVVSLGNSVTGGYTYTPLHFQITKSKSNDLLVTVFRVNQSGADETANFTYEVLYSSDEDVLNNDLNIIRKTVYPNGITIGASQSDEFAQGSDRISLFVESKDPNSTYYYRVVAKAPIADQWLLSKVMGYKIADEEASAPLPEEVRVLSVTSKIFDTVNDFFAPIDNAEETVKSSEVKLIWKNPHINDASLYYYIMLSSAQEPSEAKEMLVNILNDPNKQAMYDIKYRKVLKVNVAACDPCDANGTIAANGDYLTYTIKMGDYEKPLLDTRNYTSSFRLFQEIDGTGNMTDSLPNELEGPNGYPNYLMANKVYYIKMYTQKEPEDETEKSDDSIPVSFTTSLDVKKNPPAPMNFSNTANEILPLPSGKNSITLQWSKVPVTLSDYTTNTAATYEQYYDLYMSDSIDDPSRPFIKIGSAKKDDAASIGDIACDGQQRANSDIITAKISSFINVQDAIDRFGGSLKPNFTYYFKVKTRLVISSETDPRESEESNILTVTTLKGDIVPPGEEESGPKLPENYGVDPESEISSTSVRLVWDEMEKSTSDYTIKYSLIQTIRKLDSVEEDITDIEEVHEANNGYYSLVKYLESDYITPPDLQHPNKAAFTYNEGKFYYEVTDLEPNTIYYISLRAEKEVIDPETGLPNTLSTIWVTLPITTTLIETPTDLQVVVGNEIGVSWYANTAFDPADYSLSISEDGGSYRAVPNGDAAISEEIVGGQSRFYARIKGLKADKNYVVRVSAEKVVSGVTISDSQTLPGVSTREPMHEIEVKWKGIEDYDYEIAIKGEDEIGTVQPGSSTSSVKLSNLANEASDYYNGLVIEITSGKGAGQQRTITDYNGTTKVASLDRGWNVIPDNSSQYKIYTEYSVYTVDNANTALRFDYISREKPVDLVTTEYMMFYARIPSLKSNTKYYIKVRSVSEEQRSRYTEPVSTRTDFSQDDYDDEEQDNEESANYFDQVKKFRKSLYWIMGTSSRTFKAKIRRDMAENYIRNNSQTVFTLELLEEDIEDRELSALYIPVAVMKLLSERNSSLIVKVPGAEYNFRPNTLDYENAEEIEELKDDRDVKEVYLYIEIKKVNKSSSVPYGNTLISEMHEIEVQAVGMEYTDSEIEAAIKEKIDDFIGAGLDDLKGKSNSSKDTPKKLADTIQEIVEEVEDEYRDFIEDYIEGGGGYSSLIEDTEDISSFDVPVNVRMAVNTAVKGSKSGYLYYSSSWNRVPSVVANAGAIVGFDFVDTGRIAVLCVDISTAYNIPYTHWARNDITAFASNYDISDVFTRYSNFDSGLSVNHTILLVEKVISGGKNTTTLSLQERAKKAGIDGVVSYAAPGRSVSRQELAALTIRVYELKTGASAADLRPNRTIIINDSSTIKNSYYKPVELCVDMNFLTLDSSRNFRPKDTCSGAEAVVVLTRLMKVLGEI